MPSDNNREEHMHRFSHSEIAIVSIHEPVLVTVGQIFEFLNSMHLDPNPVHHIDDVFESIQYNGVLFVLFLPLSDLLSTQILLFLLLLLHFIDERFDSAGFRVV